MSKRMIALVGFVVLVSLVVALPAFAATPPANDDRANAESIPTFPAGLSGSTIDATVERLDPQVSQCGRIESTVWYQINQSPDGTIMLGVQAAGLAPVVRAYKLTKNGISEIDCASANAGQRAQITFESVRGASFFVIVGKKPSTADSSFTLDAQLFLPPANDAARGAQPIRSLPATVKGSTLGATTDSGDPDPDSCALVGGTVWYTVAPGSAARIVVRLHAAGDLDAAVVIRQKVRSEVDDVACAPTDRKGNAMAAVDVEKGAAYLVVVGQRKGSAPGDFTLAALAAQPAERAPGSHLASTGVRSTVNGVTDVNDMWWLELTPGTAYRIAFSSPGCATLRVKSLRNPEESLGSIECNGYTTFTPGPEGAGRYTFEVLAPRTLTTLTYRLQVAGAAEDDVGVGLELANLAHVRGTLSPSGIDVVDLYHFDVGKTSDVRLRLTQPSGRSFRLAIVTDSGSRVSSGGTEFHRGLQGGRYVAAVIGKPGARGGGYSLSLVIRQLTSTSLTVSGTEIGLGASVTLRASTTPSPGNGVLEVRIDRFDPFTGWHFNRVVRLRGSGGSLTWTPPALGRWRAHVSFLGTLGFSPSQSGYVSILVAKPIGR